MWLRHIVSEWGFYFKFMDYSQLPELPVGAKHISIIEEYRHLFSYAALPDGTILTCNTYKPTKGVKYLPEWRVKKVYVSKLGYALLKTKRGPKGKNMTDKVHRIIGSLFVPNPDNLPIINHKNGIKTDNRATNIEWCTHKHNSIHCIENNLRDTARGERIPSSILTNGNIHEIFRMKASGLMNKEIAKNFNIDVTGISKIINRKQWAHVEVPEELIRAAQLMTRKLASPPRSTKLSDFDINEIKKLRKDGLKISDIAKKFGVHIQTCGAILNNRYCRK